MESKNEFISYIQTVSLFLVGILFLIFPLVVTTLTSDAVVLPKQILLGGVVLTSLILLGVKMLLEKSVKIRRTYFDLPIFLFTVAAFLSSLFSVNRIDSLIAFVPLLLAVLLYFLVVNLVKDQNSILFLVSSLILGGVITSASSILSFFKIYLLPFPETRAQAFTPLGSLLEQAIYLAVILAITGYFSIKFLKDIKGTNAKDIVFGIASIIIIMGLSITLYQLFTTQKPFILPFETGFQTAFAAISQDQGRVLLGFLFGSGFGTYVTDFTRFKQAAFNQNPTLWSLTFVRSTSFLLELLATVGILGFSSFLFLIGRVAKELKDKGLNRENSLFFSLPLIFLLAIFLPLNFVTQTLLFIILAIFSANQAQRVGKGARFFEVELQLVAFKKGLIAIESATSHSSKTIILPFSFLILILLLAGTVGFFGTRYLLSDIAFRKSFVLASQNNGSLTYQQQTNAIRTFPYRDLYYRVFSQTNLALANSLASQTQQGSTPSAQTQQTITALIQQSINSGRRATVLAPASTANWQNLSSLYRSLIGFGQNAEAFALATQQQATALDPNNPQQYLNLGGIYYQLSQWDNAQNQFQIAINLKRDFANAYYNLGHALEQKGDLARALNQYQIVKNLVVNDKNSLTQINKEIEALSEKIKSKSEASTAAASQPTSNLNLATPQTQLPPQNPPVQIPAPSATESGR